MGNLTRFEIFPNSQGKLGFKIYTNLKRFFWFERENEKDEI